MPSRRNSASSVYIAPPPVVFKVEQGFKPVKLQQTLSISVKNYDGSETHQTIMKGSDYETLTEVTLGESGQILSRMSRRGILLNFQSLSLEPYLCGLFLHNLLFPFSDKFEFILSN